MRSVRILAPAKVNLGLAILAKRPDGYHDIDTIMAMIDLCDEIRITPSAEAGISISGMDEIPVESNLMTKAARIWSEATGIDAAWHIDITKNIPSPAGIGGGSSNAAAVLRALNALHEAPLPNEKLHEIAGSLGADCPFFLGRPAARATGIGTDLQPLNPPTGWVVIAVPRIAHSSKTATLYGALTPEDYGSSEQIDAIEAFGIHTTKLPNSFLRPALVAFPELEFIEQTMTNIAGRAILSGAGPAMYAITQSKDEADAWTDELRDRLSSGVEVTTAQFLPESPQPELLP